MPAAEAQSGAMLLALVCLWIGFAAGIVCASVMRAGGDDVAVESDRSESSRCFEEDRARALRRVKHQHNPAVRACHWSVSACCANRSVTANIRLRCAEQRVRRPHMRPIARPHATRTLPMDARFAVRSMREQR